MAATLLSGTKSSYGSPYAFYTVTVEQASRTPTNVRIKVTCTAWLQYTESYLLTGRGYGLVAGIYVGGAWRDFTIKVESESWRGKTKHTTSVYFDIPVGVTTGALTGVKFRVLRSVSSRTSCRLNEVSCTRIGISSVSAIYSNVKIAAEAVDQTKVKATLSGLPVNTGYATSIAWYLNNALVATQSRGGAIKTSVAEYTLSKCLPNTMYELKAIVKYGNTVIITKAVNVVTPQETGKLTVMPKATYAELTVSEMFVEPNYSRTVKFYYKKSGDNSYTEVTTLETQKGEAAANVLKLLSNQKYDFKAEIKDGDKVLRTFTAAVTTIKDTSLVPTAHISGVTQKLGTRVCTITWLTDKAIAGTLYKIQVKVDGTWTTLKSVSNVSSPIAVTSPAGNADVVFRITSENVAVATGVTNISDGYTFYVRDDFVWDIPKTAGVAMVITANEWNRLSEYVRVKNNDAAVPIVRKGELITAATYNKMKNAISAVSPISIADKRKGDIITAADIDALRIAVNK